LIGINKIKAQSTIEYLVIAGIVVVVSLVVVGLVTGVIGSSGQPEGGTVEDLVYLTPSDYIEFYANQGSGSDKNINGTSYSTKAWIIKVA
jgi:hypothetical protein